MADDGQSEPVARAEDWLDEQTMPRGDRPKGLEDAGPVPTAAELRRQQQEEMTSTGLGTEGQTRGAVFGVVGGAVVGAVIGAVVALVFIEASTAARVLVIVIGALAGSAAGFVYWGGRTPELENETMTATGEPGIGTTPRNPDLDDRGR